MLLAFKSHQETRIWLDPRDTSLGFWTPTLLCLKPNFPVDRFNINPNWHKSSGKRLHNYAKTPFLDGQIDYKWPFSIAMLVYQRVNNAQTCGHHLATVRWFSNIYPADKTSDVGWNPVSSQRLRSPKGTVFGIAQKHHENIHRPDSAGLNHGTLCATWTMWRKCPAITWRGVSPNRPGPIFEQWQSHRSSWICWLGTPENHKNI